MRPSRTGFWVALLTLPLLMLAYLRYRSPVPTASQYSQHQTPPRLCSASYSPDRMGDLDNSYLVPGWVESYSIWLMPKGDTAERLQREIKLLAAAHAHAPEFQPHVTLIPDIKLQGEEVVARTKELASRLKPYRINFLNVTRGAIYFQCVYILCAKEAAALHANAEARKVYEMEGLPPYMPHLSLLYSDIPMVDRDQVVAQSHKRLYGEGSDYDSLLVDTGFTVDHLSIWYTPTEDKSTATWCKVADIPLQP